MGSCSSVPHCPRSSQAQRRWTSTSRSWVWGKETRFMLAKLVLVMDPFVGQGEERSQPSQGAECVLGRTRLGYAARASIVGEKGGLWDERRPALAGPSRAYGRCDRCGSRPGVWRTSCRAEPPLRARGWREAERGWAATEKRSSAAPARQVSADGIGSKESRSTPPTTGASLGPPASKLSAWARRN